MILWKKTLDSFISVHTVSTTAFLPIIFSFPGAPISVHIALYLPTSGLESEFVEEISQLRLVVEELKEKYPEALIFLRGDSNVNPNNKVRSKILENFCFTLSLDRVPIDHKTYHHFLGEGLFDSEIDLILQSTNAPNKEKVEIVLCQNQFPEIDSHHDIILSSVLIPVGNTPSSTDFLISAPRIDHSRQKIVWSEENLPTYQAQVTSKLAKLRNDWCIPDSSASVSILLSLTNQVLNQAASSTNKSISLNSNSKPKNLKIPVIVLKAKQQLKKAHTNYKAALRGNSSSVKTAKDNLVNAKKKFRLEGRRQKHREDLDFYAKLDSLRTGNASALFKTIRSSKSSSSGAVPFLTVGNKKYVGPDVADGLFDSISTLKKQNLPSLQSSPLYASWTQDYHYILELCKNKQDLPSISLEQSTKILLRMKPNVSDFWSVTPLHYIHAGEDGLHHFNFLMNRIIMDINTSTVKELNTALALLLHKGHGKARTCDRSYRTISTCPVLAKALDIFIHDLFVDKWNDAQAATQYQGEGSSHELAALLITETIQHSLHHLKQPLFLLFLDARSAFDTVVVEFLVRNLFFTGMKGHSLLYVNN